MNKEDIIKTARTRMDDAYETEQVHIERAASDLDFLTGEGQWPEEERRLRAAENKPTLTFNALPQYVRKITGQIRQLNPAIKVSAGDHEATEEVSGIIEGIIREIEYRCDAASVYEAAAESAAQCGIGNFRIRADYCDHESFDQHLIIERIYNPFAVFYDPMAKHSTRKDASFAFVVDEMGTEAFKEAYPDAKVIDFTDNHRPEWLHRWQTADSVKVAEYYWKETKDVELAITLDGQVIEGPLPKGVEFARKRTAKRPKIMWAKISGHEVLEGPTEIPGEYIPVIAVPGEEIHLGENTYRSGAIRFAKDAAIVNNVVKTAHLETVMLQPRAPYIGTANQFKGYERFWENANTANRAYLPYATDKDAPGPPQRAQPPIASQGLALLAQQAADDMKATTGIYDASLGARSNETSGVAIRQRQQEADVGTSVYADNMAKAIAHAGQVIVSMIPKVYDTQRVVRILGADEQEKLVKINEVFQTQEGPITKNDMTVGKYATRVSVGPNYASKKEEAAQGMLEFMRMIPNVSPLIADLVARSQEWEGAERIADRLKKTVPPEIVEEDEKDQDDPEKQAAKQQQMQQAQEAQAKQMQMQEIMSQAEQRKAVAETEEAAADAIKAKAEAQKAQLELQIMQLQMGVGRVAPMPGNPAQPGILPNF